MKRPGKAAQRAQWMQAFESALRDECAHLQTPFPAGRIDWSSPTYHASIGTPPAAAAKSYIKTHLKAPK